MNILRSILCLFAGHIYLQQRHDHCSIWSWPQSCFQILLRKRCTRCGHITEWEVHGSYWAAGWGPNLEGREQLVNYGHRESEPPYIS